MRKLVLAALITSTLYVQGCGVLQGVTPETPRQSVVLLYAALESGYNTWTDRFNKNLVTPEEFMGAVSDLNRADGYVDLARDAAKAGDTETADQYLGLAQSVLDSRDHCCSEHATLPVPGVQDRCRAGT